MPDPDAPAIVFVAYSYPPMTAVGGLRVAGFAERVGRVSGDRLRAFVVTVGAPFEVSTEGDVRVLRCPDWRVRWPMRCRPTGTASVQERSAGRGGSGALKSAVRRLSRDLLVPDEQGLWLLQSGRIARMIARECSGGVAAVVSSSPPPTVHVLGRYLARRLDRPWIADYRDSWIHNPYHLRSVWRRGLDARFETGLLAAAAAVVCTAPVLRDEFAALGATMLPTGYSGEDYAASRPPVDSDVFRLLFAGQLYGGKRDSRVAIETARLLSEELSLPAGRVRAVFLGDDDGVASGVAASIGASEWVESLPATDVAGARDMMHRSGALVTISWNVPEEDGIIPGKVFEYLATGRPVVATGGSASAVGALLEESGAGCYVRDAAQAAAYVRPFVEAWLDGRPREVVPDPRFSKDRSTAALLATIDRAREAATRSVAT